MILPLEQKYHPPLHQLLQWSAAGDAEFENNAKIVILVLKGSDASSFTVFLRVAVLSSFPGVITLVTGCENSSISTHAHANLNLVNSLLTTSWTSKKESKRVMQWNKCSAEQNSYFLRTYILCFFQKTRSFLYLSPDQVQGLAMASRRVGSHNFSLHPNNQLFRPGALFLPPGRSWGWVSSGTAGLHL